MLAVVAAVVTRQHHTELGLKVLLALCLCHMHLSGHTGYVRLGSCANGSLLSSHCSLLDGGSKGKRPEGGKGDHTRA